MIYYLHFNKLHSRAKFNIYTFINCTPEQDYFPKQYLILTSS